MDVIEEIRAFVENECKKPENLQGYEPYEFHFVPMVNYANKLVDELGGDREVVMIAAWLHDIGSIMEGRKNHHESGARIAGEKLIKLGYPKEKILRVQNCIFNHRGSTQNKCNTLEEKIIAEADVLSNFDNISGIFKTALVYEGLNQGDAKKSVMCKLENKYKQLSFKKSKDLVRPKIKAARILFGENKEYTIL